MDEARSRGAAAPRTPPRAERPVYRARAKPGSRAGNSADTAGGPGGGAYSDGIYFIAFAGTPSLTSPWILQLGGHHFAVNLHYDGTAAPAPAPNFVGVEPRALALNGVTYTPLHSREVAMYARVNSLDAQAAAQLSSSFTDGSSARGRTARSWRGRASRPPRSVQRSRRS